MLRFVLLAAGAVACFAQTPADLFNKPPAEVDQALRSRISEFYQDHIDSKFRQAEALVAEDTKDYFYTANKPKYVGFEIQRIEYSEGFTRAKAVVLCEQYVMIPGFTDKPLKVPTPSTWKLVDGLWFWYVDGDALRQTPFGAMKPGPGGSSGLPAVPAPKDMVFIFTQVKADKQMVSFKHGESAEVTFTNAAQGPMSISLIGALPGIDVKLDHMNMNAGEKAVLTLKAAATAKSGVLSVRVDQTNQVIPIQVTIE